MKEPICLQLNLPLELKSWWDIGDNLLQRVRLAGMHNTTNRPVSGRHPDRPAEKESLRVGGRGQVDSGTFPRRSEAKPRWSSPCLSIYRWESKVKGTWTRTSKAGVPRGLWQCTSQWSRAQWPTDPPSHGAPGKRFLEESILLLKIYQRPTSTVWPGC